MAGLNLDFLNMNGMPGAGPGGGGLGETYTPNFNFVPQPNSAYNSPSLITGTPGTDTSGSGGWGDLFQSGGGFDQVLGGLNTGVNAYLGFQQLQMAKDQLNFTKKAFNKNYASQKRLTNAKLRDRQKIRYHERPDLYQSPDQYMKQNGVQ